MARGAILVTTHLKNVPSSNEVITEGNRLYFLKKQKYYFNLLEFLREILCHESSSFSKWIAMVRAQCQWKKVTCLSMSSTGVSETSKGQLLLSFTFSKISILVEFGFFFFLNTDEV